MTGSVPLVGVSQTSVHFERRVRPSRPNLRRSFLQLLGLQLKVRIIHNCTAQQAEPTQNPELVVGIDLGTTNSAVAVSQETRLSCEPSPVRQFLAPS